jgi:hypothetical protein
VGCEEACGTCKKKRRRLFRDCNDGSPRGILGRDSKVEPRTGVKKTPQEGREPTGG